MKHSTRDLGLGLAAAVGAANVAKLTGASLCACGHVWRLQLDNFSRDPYVAWRDVAAAAVQLANMPVLAIGAAACLWVVRLRGPTAFQIRHRVAAAWVAAALLAAATWALLHRKAAMLFPLPVEDVTRNLGLTLALGALPALWLGEAWWRMRVEAERD